MTELACPSPEHSQEMTIRIAEKQGGGPSAQSFAGGGKREGEVSRLCRLVAESAQQWDFEGCVKYRDQAPASPAFITPRESLPSMWLGLQHHDMRVVCCAARFLR